MSTTQSLTTVNATGVALAKFDVLKVKVSVEARGATSEKSKDKAGPIVGAITAAIAKLEASGVQVDRASLKADTTTAAQKRYDQASGKQKPDGYATTYDLSFKCPDVDRASEIQDALSSIEGVSEVSTDFKIKELAALHKAALKDAKAKADERFANECEILGLTGSDYALSTYNVRYDDSQSAGAQPMRAAMSLESVQSDAPQRKAIQIEAGQAKVTATIAITYAPKTAQKATRSRATSSKSGNGGAATAPRAATAG